MSAIHGSCYNKGLESLSGSALASSPTRAVRGRWGGRPIRDWADLLQPRLRGRLAMVDSPRELVAIALATLGLPLNASAADMDAAGVRTGALRARVDELRQQVHGCHACVPEIQSSQTRAAWARGRAASAGVLLSCGHRARQCMHASPRMRLGMGREVTQRLRWSNGGSLPAAGPNPRTPAEYEAGYLQAPSLAGPLFSARNMCACSAAASTRSR